MRNREQAVAELVASDDPWLKSCGVYAIGTFVIKSLEGELGKCMEHPDPLLRETARAAKVRLSPQTLDPCRPNAGPSCTAAPPIRPKRLTPCATASRAPGHDILDKFIEEASGRFS